MPDPPRSNQVSLAARAKINLGLEVVGKRSDRYHEIRTLMQSIELSDHLDFDPIRGSRIQLRCPGSDLPVDQGNLVFRAARLVQETCPDARGTRITLHKSIPVGAGLGGGSSDAAATLVGMNRLWRLRLSPRQLEQLAARLGSDVPFFIRGGTQLATGRGERLTRLRALPRIRVAVVSPTLLISTASVYQDRKIPLTPMGPLSRLPTCNLTTHWGVLSYVARLHNDLESVVVRRHPEVARLRQRLLDLHGSLVRVTGSGSSLFVLSRDPRALRRAMGRTLLEDCRVTWTWFARRGWVSVGSGEAGTRIEA